MAAETTEGFRPWYCLQMWHLARTLIWSIRLTERACIHWNSFWKADFAGVIFWQDSLGSKETRVWIIRKVKAWIPLQNAPQHQASCLLLMNGGEQMKGHLKATQRVCYILESLLCNGTEMPSSLIAGTPEAPLQGDGWARVADRVLIEALEENHTSATSIILRFSKVRRNWRKSQYMYTYSRLGVIHEATAFSV